MQKAIRFCFRPNKADAQCRLQRALTVISQPAMTLASYPQSGFSKAARNDMRERGDWRTGLRSSVCTRDDCTGLVGFLRRHHKSSYSGDSGEKAFDKTLRASIASQTPPNMCKTTCLYRKNMVKKAEWWGRLLQWLQSSILSILNP